MHPSFRELTHTRRTTIRGMNLASLRYLVALSEHRHFARAAEACHITQPTLSNALRSLEHELGVAIVRRGRTFAGLTEEGERVLTTARRMVRENELLREELHGSEAQPQGTLRIGTVPTALPLATRFLGNLRYRHPGIAAQMRSLSSADIEADLEDQKIDLGLGFCERAKGREGRFDLLPQYEEGYFLVRRRLDLDALVVGEPCSWRVAAKAPLCLLSPQMHHRQIVNAAFEKAGVTVKAAMETDSVHSLLLAASQGSFEAIVPGSLVTTATSSVGLEAMPLVLPSVRTPVGFFLLARSTQSRTLRCAVALAQDPEWLQELSGHPGKLTPSVR